MLDIHADIIDGDKFVKIDLPGDKKDIGSMLLITLEISTLHKEEEEKQKTLRKCSVVYYRIFPLLEKVISSKAKAKLR